MTFTKLPAAGCIACLALLAACEHPGAPAPRLAPSPAANAAAAAEAVDAPAAGVQGAAAALANRVDGWNLPRAVDAAPGATRGDGAALAASSSPENLAAARAALDAFLQASAAPAPKAPPE